MKHRKMKLQEKKKKAGWVLSACRLKEVEEVLKSSRKVEEILFTSLYRGIPHLRWREAQRARRRLCKSKGRGWPI